MSSVELWLLEKLLSEAGSPAVKTWVLGELKKADVAATNPLLKAVIEAAEAFLAAKAVA